MHAQDDLTLGMFEDTFPLETAHILLHRLVYVFRVKYTNNIIILQVDNVTGSNQVKEPSEEA